MKGISQTMKELQMTQKRFADTFSRKEYTYTFSGIVTEISKVNKPL